MKLSFIKMHALGNDFILIDKRYTTGNQQKAGAKTISRLSQKLCSRRFGIGADQLLLLSRSKKADCKMRIFNADGGEVEMCGNGIRCVAKHIWDSKVRRKKDSLLKIETLAGIMHLKKTRDLIRVDMGEPVLEARKIPVNIPRARSHLRNGMVINYPFTANSKTFRISCVSMGNPHTVIVVKDIGAVPLHHYGPLIENNRFFPNRTNVEFIQILNQRNIKMRVWERGAGETPGCGTGASAACVVSALLRLTGRKVTVHLSGGRLYIDWSVTDNHVYMTGPAVKVFDGIIQI
jgi:diaminopimelate epimerase